MSGSASGVLSGASSESKGSAERKSGPVQPVATEIHEFTAKWVAETLQKSAESLKTGGVFSEQFATEMDRADPLAKFRGEFHVPRAPPFAEDSPESTYLCGNSLGLMPRRASKYVNEELQKWATHGVEGHFLGARPWVPIVDDTLVTRLTAKLVGASVDEVAVMNSLSVNLHVMMTSFYRPTKQRHKLVIEEGAFCSDYHVVKSQIQLQGFDVATSLLELKPRAGEHCLRTEDILATIEREGESVALVMLPGVQFYTGQLFDMKAITATGHKHGCFVGFDLAHAVGNVPLRLHDWGPDFACWCTYKYLNSGPGCIAGTFVHSRHAKKSFSELPRLCGWWGQELADRFAMKADWRMKEGAQGWQVSCPPVLAVVCLLASLEVFDEAGMQALRRKSVLLTGYLEALLRHELVEKDGSAAFSIITPCEPEARGCQLSLLLKVPVRAVHKRLEALGVICDIREPNVIRITPVPLYNTFSDVRRFVQLLKKALADTHAA